MPIDPSRSKHLDAALLDALVRIVAVLAEPALVPDWRR
jgi:hypothetical protein